MRRLLLLLLLSNSFMHSMDQESDSDPDGVEVAQIDQIEETRSLAAARVRTGKKRRRCIRPSLKKIGLAAVCTTLAGMGITAKMNQMVGPITGYPYVWYRDQWVVPPKNVTHKPGCVYNEDYTSDSWPPSDLLSARGSALYYNADEQAKKHNGQITAASAFFCVLEKCGKNPMKYNRAYTNVYINQWLSLSTIIALYLGGLAALFFGH